MKYFLIKFPVEIWLLLTWAFLILLIDPSGEFPINDDFAYSRNVWHLSEEGRFLFSDWPGMTLIIQTLIGSAACTLFGFSFLTLRLLTLVFAMGFLSLLYRFLQLMGLAKGRALFVLLLILFNPFFLSLSFTFMTEIYFLFFVLAGLCCYTMYLERSKAVYLVIFALSAMAATLIRQTGLMISVAVCLVEGLRVLLWMLRRKRMMPSAGHGMRSEQNGMITEQHDGPGHGGNRYLPWNAVLALMILLLNFAGLRLFEYWAISTGNLPVNYGRAGDLFELLNQEHMDYFMRKAGTMLMYAGLFLLPLSLRLMPSLRMAGDRPGRIVQSGLFIFLAILIFMGMPEFPRPNVFYNLGVGPKLLKDSYWGENISPSLGDAVWNGIKYLAAGGGLILAAIMGHSVHRKLRIGRLLNDRIIVMKYVLAAMTGGFTLYLLLNRFYFDRYTLPLTMLAAILLGMIPYRPRPFIRFAGLGLLGIMGLFSTLAVRDYMEWQRTRWEALAYLTGEKGIDPRRIDGGLEFNGWYETGPFNPAQKGEKSWWFVTEDEYVVAAGMIEGYEPVRSFVYQRWLWPGKDSLLVLWHEIPGKLSYDVYPLRCDCESLAENPYYLLSTDGQVRFEGGALRSEAHARSGRYAVHLTEQQPYGLLHKFIDVEPGETFMVRVWKFGPASGVRIVSGGGAGCHTVMADEVSRTDENGWELMELQATIPEGFGCHHYGIFIWNSGEGEVWLDDLEITRSRAD